MNPRASEPRPVDRESERGQIRDRLIATAIAVSLIVRVVTGLASLGTVAVLARHLPAAQVGLVLTLVTVWYFITGTTDLGVGAITTTRVARAAGREDLEDMRRQTDHALAVLGGLGVIVAILGSVAAVGLPTSAWLTHNQLASSVVIPAVIVTCAAAALALAGAVGDAVLGGLQRQTAQQVRAGLGSVAALPACIVAATANLPVWCFVVALIGVPALGSMINTIWVMGIEYPHLRPRPGAIEAQELRSLLGVSGYLALMRIGDTVSAGTGTIIVSAVEGPSAAAVYGIATRIYALGASVIQVAATKVWPGVAEAIARRDYDWAARRFRHSVALVAAVSSAAALVLVVAGSAFAHAWVGAQLTPSAGLFAALGLMLIATPVIGQLVIILLTQERLRVAGLTFLAIIVPTVAASVAATHWIGMTGAALVPAVVYTVVLIPVIATQSVRALRSIRDEEGSVASA